jgi:hypothetical protein
LEAFLLDFDALEVVLVGFGFRGGAFGVASRGWLAERRLDAGGRDGVKVNAGDALLTVDIFDAVLAAVDSAAVGLDVLIDKGNLGGRVFWEFGLESNDVILEGGARQGSDGGEEGPKREAATEEGRKDFDDEVNHGFFGEFAAGEVLLREDFDDVPSDREEEVRVDLGSEAFDLLKEDLGELLGGVWLQALQDVLLRDDAGLSKIFFVGRRKIAELLGVDMLGKLPSFGRGRVLAAGSVA